MPHRTMIALSVASCLSLVLAGCGGDSANYPSTVSAKGKVTLDGQAVEGATITFRPVDEKGHSARALSGPDGTFELLTYFSPTSDEKGAVPGKYRVSVTKVDQGSGPASHDAANTGPPADMRRMMQAARGTGGPMTLGPTNILPKKYENPDSSGLEVEIQSGQENTIPLELTSN